MTRAKLHRLISKKLDPKMTPDSGFWRRCYSSRQGPHGQPLDYSHSEDASAKLLDVMLEPELWLESNANESPKLWGCVPDMNDNLIFAFGDDRKSAVLLAAAKWKGIEIGPEGLED